MLKNNGGVFNIPNYVISHIGRNATFGLYKTMSLEQILFIVGYALVAYPLYLLNSKVSKFINDRLFSNREFKDE